ncbi:MAG: hypothetical protein J7647_23615 [Cyanobacteria bacterium SBLK]|nr:hypothetical protein [Cyanobacteria bacterium SBLK]
MSYCLFFEKKVRREGRSLDFAFFGNESLSLGKWQAIAMSWQWKQS